MRNKFLKQLCLRLYISLSGKNSNEDTLSSCNFQKFNYSFILVRLFATLNENVFTMLLSDILLAFSAIAAIVSFRYYSREKRVLREFIRQSRRHNHHRNLDLAMQKKASRYLVFSIAFSLITIPLLVQKVIELFEASS